MLGRPYAIRGQVVPGDHRGRLLGFPTANLKLLGQHFAVPAFGVYAGRVLVDGQWHDAMVNVGDNPTFANQETRLEAHLFRFQGDLYGKEVRVQLVARLRGEEKFPDLDRLQEQLRKAPGMPRASWPWKRTRNNGKIPCTKDVSMILYFGKAYWWR